MSVHAGQILTVAGRTVLQRVQSQGLGDVNIPVDTIREVGNPLVVDKVIQEPDFTFSIESLDVSCDLEAMAHGKVGGTNGSGAAAADANGTEYPWETCVALHIESPWKVNNNASGTVQAGHLLPNYYPTRVQYSFGVTDNAQVTMELGGGGFYYGKFAPVEDIAVGDGSTVAFVTTRDAVNFRKGGVAGTTFRAVLGVLVDGVPQIEDADFALTGGAVAPGSPSTVTFTTAPATGAVIRIAYFTSHTEAYPKSVNKSAIVQPGAVRGRNVVVDFSTDGGSTYTKLPSVQTAQLQGTYDTTVERELGSDEPTGRDVTGTDTSGTIVYRGRDAVAFFDVLQAFTGLDTDSEVVGYINTNVVRLRIRVQNPKNPGTILKTWIVKQCQFNVPGTPARVNQPTDFSLSFQAQDGTHSVYKGSAS